MPTYLGDGLGCFLHLHNLSVIEQGQVVDHLEGVRFVATGAGGGLRDVPAVNLYGLLVTAHTAPEHGLAHLRHNVGRARHHASDSNLWHPPNNTHAYTQHTARTPDITSDANHNTYDRQHALTRPEHK